MSILRKLTLRHLVQNRRRTAITLVGIALSVAMITAVSGFVVSFQDLLYQESVKSDGLWHVRYRDVPKEVVEQVVAEPVFSHWELEETEEGTQLSLLFTRLHKSIFGESEAICDKYGIHQDQVRYHNDLLIAKGIVPGPYYGALYSFAGILLCLVAAGSVLVISNAFTISSEQRSVQFGLLKSTGATRSQIRGMVFFEGIVLVCIAIPVGILAGLSIQWGVLAITNRVLASMSAVNLSVHFRVILSPLALAGTAAAAFLTVLAAAWLPARKAGRVSAVEAIRQTRSIQLSRRQIRVSPLTRLVFGFEGALAAKAMGRNRGKYRAAILSLVVSIVLFMGVSSFGDILRKATSMMYQDLGSNVMFTMQGGSQEHQDAVLAEMETWEMGAMYPSRRITGSITLPQEALSKDFQQHFDHEPPLQLFGIGEEAFAALCRSLGLDPEDLASSEGLEGILINTTGTYVQQGRRITFTPYRLSQGDRFTIWVEEGQEREITVAGIAGEIPPGALISFDGAAVNIIVPDRDIAGMWDPNYPDLLQVAVMADDAAAFTARASAYLEEQLPGNTWSIFDFEKQAANNHNIDMLVMLFVYGFIAMLTLIGITSVITTITTSIALRTREFAMLRSVGMTQGSMAKMLRYESLLYGVRALLWGIPLGTMAAFLMHKAMTSVMDFPFVWPLHSIAVSIVGVLVITFATMRVAHRRQRQVNIVSALRDDIL